MKKCLLLFLLSLSLLKASDEYEQVVDNFIYYKGVDKQILSKVSLDSNGSVVAYVYSLSNKGYVLVPKSKLFSPIKAYSFDKDFSELPTAYREFLIKELVISSKLPLSKRVSNSTTSSKWDFLLSLDTTSRVLKKSYTPNTYLLTTSWNQTYPYNKYFPTVNGQETLAGCVQVAMGQLMNYHSYPNISNGVASYSATISNKLGLKVRDENLTAVLNRYLNWDLMSDDLSSSETNESNIDEVAYLLRDLVVVNRADIGLETTSASANMEAMVKNYGYSNTIAKASTDSSRSYYTPRSEFISILKEQIDSSLPVLFSLPGHMVVADGYRDDSVGSWIHLNMGWGGSSNDYYNIDENIYTSSYNFDTTDLDMIYNIKPCDESVGDCYRNLEDSDTIDNFSINGKFDMEYDSDVYELFLSGDTTISEPWGYYIEIYDMDGNLIISSSDMINMSFESGKYQLKVTLENYEGYYYYLSNHQSRNYEYSVDVVTSELSESEKELVESSLVYPIELNQTISNQIISDKKSLLINAFSKSADVLEFQATSSENLDVNFTNNILNITPKVSKGYGRVYFTLKTPTQSMTKSFDLLINDEKLYVGREFTISGTFDYEDEIDEYKVVLDGECSIEGYNGYINQAFYSALTDMSDNYLNSMNNADISSDDLALDFYKIKASLSNPETWAYYNFDNTNKDYTLNVTCNEYEDNITKLAELLNIEVNTTLLDQQPVVEPTVVQKELSLDGEWSLVGIDANLSELNSSISIIWQYDNNQWFGYSPKEPIINEAIDSYFTLLDTINPTLGTWVYSSLPITQTTKVDSSLDKRVFSDGWSLNSTYTDINISELSCENNQEISIWKYDSGWSVLNSDNPSLNENDGFWSYCK